MRDRAKKYLMFSMRWGIAVLGIWWVVSNMSWRDHVLALDADNRPFRAPLATRDAAETAQSFDIVDPTNGQTRTLPRTQVINKPEKKNPRVTRLTPDGPKQVPLLGLDLSGQDLRTVERLLVEEDGKSVWIAPNQVQGGYVVNVPHPRVEVGIRSLLHGADPWYLALAVLIFPLTYVITSIRWHELLKAVEINLTLARVFVLSMVGAFYNTFMPGSTGGDVLKAYYAGKHTPHKGRAWFSVVIDRLVGMMALILLGGVMAAWQWLSAGPDTPPAVVAACRRVAIGSGLLFVALAVGAEVLVQPKLRKALGVDWLIDRLPGRRHLHHVIDIMYRYRKRTPLMLGALLATLPVHITVVVSAMLAGKAFGLPIPTAYYFVAVPVIVLAGAVPISPQGAGVMEFFALILTQQYGMKVSQAFALTMSIRLVQMFWNLTGGVFVFRGGYHAPTTEEQKELEADDEGGDPAQKEGPPLGVGPRAS